MYRVQTLELQARTYDEVAELKQLVLQLGKPGGNSAPPSPAQFAKAGIYDESVCKEELQVLGMKLDAIKEVADANAGRLENVLEQTRNHLMEPTDLDLMLMKECACTCCGVTPPQMPHVLSHFISEDEYDRLLAKDLKHADVSFCSPRCLIRIAKQVRARARGRIHGGLCSPRGAAVYSASV